MPALVFSAATRKSRKRVASSHLSALSELSSLTPKALEAGGGCNKADALAVARLKASLYCFLRVKWSANLSHSIERIYVISHVRQVGGTPATLMASWGLRLTYW